MKYNLADQLDRQRFNARVKSMLERGSFVELKDCARRTINQNSYLHLLLGVVALDTGNTLEYVKTWYFKKLVNPDIFIVRKRDPMLGQIEDIRSTTELTKDELSEAIDRFKRWGNENEFYMPEPGDEQLCRLIEIEMGRQEKRLRYG